MSDCDIALYIGIGLYVSIQVVSYFAARAFFRRMDRRIGDA